MEHPTPLKEELPIQLPSLPTGLSVFSLATFSNTDSAHKLSLRGCEEAPPNAFGVKDRNRRSLENLVETFPATFENCRQCKAARVVQVQRCQVSIVWTETAVKSEILTWTARISERRKLC